MLNVIFTPPPTPNGGLHVGHVAGPYLRADLNVRLLRLLGRPAVHASHIDNYQTYVQTKAVERGRDVDEFRRDMISAIGRDYASFDIGFGSYIDNTEPAYTAYLEQCIAELLADKHAVLRDEQVTADGRSAVEAFVSGLCPECLQVAAANVCENCGRPLDLTRMIAPRSEPSGRSAFTTASSTVPTVLEIDDVDLETLRAAYGSIARDDVFISDLVDRVGPHEVTLTLRNEYGFPAGDGRVINPWIEIFFAHMYALGRILGLPERCTPDDVRSAVAARPDVRVAYYFGVDNTYYYAVLFPILAGVMGMPGAIPVALKANRFLRLGGKKISSSKNNAVWAADLAGTGPVRGIRGGLAASCPEFAEREYDPAAIAAADAPESGGSEWADATTVTGRVFADAIERLADPTVFTVRDTVNRIRRAREALATDRLPAADSAELERMVTTVEAALCL